MNWKLNTGWNYRFAKTQEEWDMIDRAGIIEECARIAKNACLVPPDGGSPTEAERLVCEEAARQIRARAAVPPAPSDADHTPVERLRAVLETQASPTIDRGDSHGARGQKGWLVWESSLPFIAANLAAVPRPPSSDVDFTVDDTLLARSILTFLGRAGEASLEPGMDFHRDRIAAMICADRERRYLAPPSIPEREKVLEAISRAHYQFDRHTPCMSRGHAEAILSAIAALERK